MVATRPVVLDHDRAGLDAIWEALAPDKAHSSVLIRAVMIASIDGSTTLDGRSGALGTPADRLVYDAMRARADVILVGSGTALAEGYRAAKVADVWADRRRRPAPKVIVLSRSVPDELIELCRAADGGIDIAVSADTDQIRIDTARTNGVAVHILQPGPYEPALRHMLDDLGAAQVAFEGGPSLLGELLSLGAVDELVLSIAPEIVIGGGGPGLVMGAELHRVPMRIASAFSCPDGGLYTRWTVERNYK